MASFCPIFCPFLKMHRGKKMVLGVIWRKTGKRKEGERIPKPGTQVEYKGKKYVSLKELSKDINVPYTSSLVRRLIPLECERLMGFPDYWTDIPGASDSARYRALGNSVAVPCVDFILCGIAFYLLKMGGG